MPELKKQPLFTMIDPIKGSGAMADGNVITQHLIMKYGWAECYYKSRSEYGKDIIETTICTIIQKLCDHLEKLTSSK